jgi:hypothetical protein
MLFHIHCCTQDQFICSSHFVFLCFPPLVVVVGANGVVFFIYLVVLIQVFVQVLIVSSCCFTLTLFVVDVFLRSREVVTLC